MELWVNNSGQKYEYLGGLVGVLGVNFPIICPFCNKEDTRNTYDFDHELVIMRLQLLNEIKGVDSIFFVKNKNNSTI
jgi:hypothetical protein